jgi:two-component system response regulator AtoC
MPELNVLVVDDEPAVRQVLAAAIGKAGYSVDAVGSAAEALARWTRRPTTWCSATSSCRSPTASS